MTFEDNDLEINLSFIWRPDDFFGRRASVMMWQTNRVIQGAKYSPWALRRGSGLMPWGPRMDSRFDPLSREGVLVDGYD